MKIIIVILLLSVQQLLSQTISGSFVHGGITRNYAVYLPSGYNSSNSHPLVLNLHGYGSNGTQQAVVSEMNLVADTAQFIVVYPEGTLDASFKQFWNANYGAAVDDIGFLNALVDTLSAQYNINPLRVYSTGYSNGAIMSNTLACESANRFAAIAGVAGTMTPTQQTICAASRTIPVMHVHGTADIVVAYNGGSLLIAVDSLIAHWVQHNGLVNSPVNTPIPNNNIFDNCTAEVFDYGIGTINPVKLIKVTGGTHTWPGSFVQTGSGTNQDFDASVEIWRFFNQYSLLTPTSKLEDVDNDFILQGQNPVVNVLTWNSELAAYSVAIYNLLGQELLAQKIDTKGFQQLSISNLEKGMLLAVFKGKNKIQTIQFIHN